jgi:alpha-methylacyl-CoA racemase
MIDGAAVLGTMMYSMIAQGVWRDERGVNLLDTGAHFYDTYETKDGKYVSIGSIEPQFYAELIRLGELDTEVFGAQMDIGSWPEMKEKLAAVFKQKTRDEWCAIMENTDVCFAPVLSLMEATKHPHNVQRGTFFEQNGHVQPAPAPRFSRTKPALPAIPPTPGAHTEQALADWGFATDEIARLKAAGAVV